MAGLDPAIHVFSLTRSKTWTPGTRPGVTGEWWRRISPEQMPAPFVEFSRLTVEYPSKDGPVHALDAIDLAFDAGDFVCIVGPSGCGKTTLMQTLAGFLAPTSGYVSLSGRPITGPGPD